MHDISPELEALLKQPHRPVARITFLSDLDTALAEANPLDGQVQMDRNRDLTRSGSVKLANTTGAYTPTSTGLVWPFRQVRVERGLYNASGVPQYVPLMTGLLDEPRVSEGSDEVSFNVWSRLRLADQQFSVPVSFAPGLRVGVMLRRLCELAGLGTNDLWYNLQDGGAANATDRAYDVSDNILRAMTELAKDHALSLGDDAYGRIVSAPFVDPSTVSPVWTFQSGADATMTALDRTLRASRIYNRQDVVGYGPDMYPIRASARVTNPASPLLWSTSYNFPAPPYLSSDIRTQGQANAVALMLLYQKALLEESVGAASVPIPGLEAGDIVKFVGIGTDMNYILDSVSTPLGPGAMSMATRAARSLL